VLTCTVGVLANSGNGTDSGEGAGCIKDPKTGECGCENSIDGKFIAGKTDCK
jgi:hypothetical protein